MLSLPTPLTAQHTCRLPRSASGDAHSALAGGICLAPTPAWRHPDPVCQPSEPLLPRANLVCQPAGGACVHLPSCRRRSREAPFFRGLHRLAVHHSRTWLLFSTISHSQLATQGIIDTLPYTSGSPLSEVPINHLPGRQVSGQHTPGAAAPQEVEYGVDYLSKLIFRLAPCVSTSWKEWLKHLPLLVCQVAWIRWSSRTHADSLPYTLAFCQCC